MTDIIEVDEEVYTVWAGGVPDIKNVDLGRALYRYDKLIDYGHDDVCIERVEKNSKAKANA